jgi:hypothetical protein
MDDLPVTPKAERTIAESYIATELQRLLPESGRYRVGALLLTYAGEGPRDRQVSSGVALQSVDIEAGVDLLFLVKRLRSLADELDRMILGASLVTVDGAPFDASAKRTG